MRQTLILLIVVLAGTNRLSSQSVGIGTVTPDNSAQLEINSTAKGFLPPRMTTAQRNAIVNPAAGLMIFNTTTGNIEYYNDSFWSSLSINPVPPIAMGARRLLGGTNVDDGNAILETSDGGYIIAGISFSSNSGTLAGISSNGSVDFMVIKMDAAANIQWQRLLGGTSSETITGLCQTPDGGYIIVGGSSSSNTGTFAGVFTNGSVDCAVIKLDAAGNVLWKKLLGGTSIEYGTGIAITADGGCILSGYTYSSNTGTLAGLISNGDKDALVIKLDAAGNMQWQYLFGGNTEDEVIDIGQAPDGTYIMAGNSYSSNSGTLTGITNNGAIDAWIVKFDNTGTIIWQHLLGGTGSERVRALTMTPDSGCLVMALSNSSNTGTMTGLINNGGNDMLLIKLDGLGTTQWQKLYGGSASDDMTDIVSTTDGGFVAAGRVSHLSINTGTLTGIPNAPQFMWVVKVDSTGNLAWQGLHGGIGANGGGDQAYGITQTAAGDLLITGATDASNNGSFSGLFANGTGDAFMIRLNKYGIQF